MPIPDDMVCVIPQQVVFLGEALAPVAKSARQAVTQKIRSSGHEFITLEDVSRHMGVIQQALTHLTPRPDNLMIDVIHQEDAGAIAVGRAAGRLEQVLSEFVDGYFDAKASHADGQAIEARRLILGVYRHHITEICDWLEELVAVITDPVPAIQRRGMPVASRIKLTVALNLTTPPEMAGLEALAMSLQQTAAVPSDAASRVAQPGPPAPGLLGTLGALAFGAGLAEEVLGRRRG